MHGHNVGWTHGAQAALPVGRCAIAAPLPERAGAGVVDAHREGRRYIVHSDELLSAFLELERTLL